MKTKLPSILCILLFGHVNAQTWYDFPTDLEPTWVQDFEIVDNSTFFLTTNYGEIRRSLNGGVNWENVHGSAFMILGIDFPTTNTGYASGSNDTWYKSTDGGATWTANNLSGSFSDVFFIDELTGFMVGSETAQGTIWKTTDGGSSWTFQTVATGNLQSVKFLDSNVGYACGNNMIFKTTDQGATWTNVYTAGTTNAVLNSIDVLDASNAIACGGLDWDPVILRTTDGGTTWNLEAHPLDQSYNSIWEVQYEGSAVYAVSGDAVLRSTDGGSTWTQDAVTATNPLNFQYIEFTPAGLGFVGGAGYLFTDSLIVNDINQYEELSVVAYPNPVKNVLQLKISGADEISVILMDMSGNLVRSELVVPDGNAMELDWFGSLTSGVYFLRIESNAEAQVIRIVRE